MTPTKPKIPKVLQRVSPRQVTETYPILDPERLKVNAAVDKFTLKCLKQYLRLRKRKRPRKRKSTADPVGLDR